MGMGLRTVGRSKSALTANIAAELTDEDLDELASNRGVAPPAITKLRERHHALARHLAEGKSPGEAALLTRYTQSRVSILLGDPAFQDLVSHYRGLVNEQFVDFQAKLKELAIDAAHVIQERIEDAPDEISDAMPLRIVEVGADRTGHGPSVKQDVNIRIGLAQRLTEARERAQMIDVTPASEPRDE